MDKKKEKQKIIDSLINDVMNQKTFMSNFSSLEEEKQKEIVNSMYSVFSGVADTVLSLNEAQVLAEANLTIKININEETNELSKDE